MEFIIIFQIIVLIFSAVVHEVAHGFMAEHLGDPTARLMGRLTLNPIKHLDLFGSILLPLLLFFSGSSVLFGWAKPVPYNPARLKDPERDGAKIALAGPASNFLLAILFSIVYHIFAAVGNGLATQLVFLELIKIIVIINISLGVFNLVPIPPLDGSKIWFVFLPKGAYQFRVMLERYGLVILLVFIFFGFKLIAPIIKFLFNLLIGT